MALSRYNLHIKQNLVVAPGPRSLSGPCGRTFPKGGAWPESSPALLRAWPSLSPSRAVLSLHCMWVWPALPCCPRARLRVRPDFGEGPCLPSCCGLSLPHAQGGAGPGVPAGRPGPLPLCPPTASASLPPSRSCLAALHRRGPGDLLGPWVRRAQGPEIRRLICYLLSPSQTDGLSHRLFGVSTGAMEAQLDLGSAHPIKSTKLRGAVYLPRSQQEGLKIALSPAYVKSSSLTGRSLRVERFPYSLLLPRAFRMPTERS